MAFEVASIKPNNSGDGRVMMQNQPGRFTATNITLRLLIRNAYQLQDSQITGGPSWIASDHYDLIAKMPDGFQPTFGPRRRPAVRRHRFSRCCGRCWLNASSSPCTTRPRTRRFMRSSSLAATADSARS